MNYKTLPKTGFKVSEVSFGCMSLKSGTKDNDGLIGKAMDAGINLFDTADLYEHGKNEELLGKALKGNRENLHISTKVGNRWRADGSGWDWCPRKEYILNAVNESLERLQTDYIDLYLLHGGIIDDPIDETIEAFERLVETGKIRSYGISSIRPNVIREYVKRSNIAAVMMQYSLLDRRPEEEMLELLLQNEIGVLARGTIAGGLLAGKPAKEYLNRSAEDVESIQKKFTQVLPQMPDSSKAIRYVLENPAITAAVAGIRTAAQLNAAVNAAQIKLSGHETDLLGNIGLQNYYEQHR